MNRGRESGRSRCRALVRYVAENRLVQGMRMRFRFGILLLAVFGCGFRVACASEPVPAPTPEASPPHQTLTIDSRVLRETRRI
jgi:hypothetical protein